MITRLGVLSVCQSPPYYQAHEKLDCKYAHYIHYLICVCVDRQPHRHLDRTMRLPVLLPLLLHVFAEKSTHQVSDLVTVFLRGEVTCIEKVKL